MDKHNGLSIAGFVVSCCSAVIPPLSFFAPVGLFLSGMGRCSAVQNGDKTGLATAGMVVGLISSILWYVVIFVYALLLEAGY